MMKQKSGRCREATDARLPKDRNDSGERALQWERNKTETAAQDDGAKSENNFQKFLANCLQANLEEEKQTQISLQQGQS